MNNLLSQGLMLLWRTELRMCFRIEQLFITQQQSKEQLLKENLQISKWKMT